MAPPLIDFATVTQVYCGTAGACCCGCEGTHTTTAESPDHVWHIVSTMNRLAAAWCRDQTN